MFFLFLFVFFFNDTATTEIYTLSLHDALPISWDVCRIRWPSLRVRAAGLAGRRRIRSEEHTSELQSLTNLVCRLLLEKKKKHTHTRNRQNKMKRTYDARSQQQRDWIYGTSRTR